MSAIVFDANYLVGWLDQKDSWHPAVRAIAEALPKNATRLILDVSLTEALSVMARRCEEQQRPRDFLTILSAVKAEIPPKNVEWILPLVRSYYDDCLALMEGHHGKFNFNDALIISFMKQQKLVYIVSFDGDFDAIPWIRRIHTAEQAAKT